MPRPKKQVAIDGTPRGNSHAGSLLSALLGNAQQDISVKPQGTMTQNINDTAAPVPNRMVVTPNNIFAKGNASSMQNQLDINRMLQQQAMADQLGLQSKLGPMQTQEALALEKGKIPIEVDKQKQMDALAFDKLVKEHPVIERHLANVSSINLLSQNNINPADPNAKEEYIKNVNPKAQYVTSKVAENKGIDAETSGLIARAAQPTDVRLGIDTSAYKSRAARYGLINQLDSLERQKSDSELISKNLANTGPRTLNPGQIEYFPNTGVMVKSPTALESLQGKNPSISSINGGGTQFKDREGNIINGPSSFESYQAPTTGNVNQPVKASQEELKAKMPMQSPLLQGSSINSIPTINPSIALPKAAPTQEEIDNAERVKKALNLFMQNNFGVPAFKTQ